jgi:hypothetical protein
MKSLAINAWRELHPAFKILAREVMDSDDDRLSLVGLSGNQLKFKMYVFNFFLKKNAIKKVLEAINSILGSLSLVFPLAESIKEFKDFLELGNENI